MHECTFELTRFYYFKMIKKAFKLRLGLEFGVRVSDRNEYLIYSYITSIAFIMMRMM